MYFLRFSVALSLFLFSQPGRSQIMATDVGTPDIFKDNPAEIDPDHLAFSYRQINTRKNTEATMMNDTVQPEIKNKVVESIHEAGLLLPLGGGAGVVFQGGMLNKDIESELSTSSNQEEESFEETNLALRLTLKIVDRIRAGLGMRYQLLEADVVGRFFEDDITSYKGNMTGYEFGLFYSDGLVGFGFVYVAPMKGKAKLGDEQIILTQPGWMSVDLSYGKEWRIAASARRWLHKRDDRADDYTVPGTEDEIFLMGLELDQFVLPTMQYHLGFDTAQIHSLHGRFDVGQNHYVFLGDPYAVPGDQDDEKLSGYSAAAAAVFHPSDFAISLGYRHEILNKDRIRDASWRMAGNYEDYKREAKLIFASFNYRK